MKILVTGAAGFIGSHTAVSLSREGHIVLGVDNYSDYYSPKLKKMRSSELLGKSGIKLENLDLTDRKATENLVANFQPDTVIHLAAQAGVRLTVEESYKYVDSNLSAFSNILISVIKNKIPNFLYASSSSVYGDFSRIPYSENETNLIPNSFYGATKIANELLAASLSKDSATKTRGLRFFTVYGPWGRPDMAYFRLVGNAIANAPFTLFGDGSIERDFTYIDDAVSSISALCQELNHREAGFSDVVNIGGGHPLSMKYLQKLISEITGKRLQITETLSNRNDVLRTMADDSYLRSLIGKAPTIALDQGINDFVNWAKLPTIKNELTEWIKSVR